MYRIALADGAQSTNYIWINLLQQVLIESERMSYNNNYYYSQNLPEVR